MKSYCDGACRVSNPGQCACAFAVFKDGKLWQMSSRYLGPMLYTNNYAEYMGLLDCLKWADAEGVTGLDIYTDSQLIQKQVSGLWGVKHEELQPLRALAYALLTRGGHRLHWVRGHNGDPGNELVDQLCNEVLDREIGVRK